MAKLTIGISIKSNKPDNAKKIVQNLFKLFPLFLREFRFKSLIAAKNIAPVGPLQNSEVPYGRLKSRKAENRSESIKDSIFIKTADDGISFTLGAQNNYPDGVKVIMQEYGYPYDTTEDSTGDDDDSEETNNFGNSKLRRGFKPYPPNPKNSRRYKKLLNSDIRGVGYIRAALVSTSKQIAYGYSGNRLPSVSKSDVLNYEAVVKRNLEVAIMRFVIDYSKGKMTANFSERLKVEMSSSYIEERNRLQLEQFTPISKYANKFGTVVVDFDGLLSFSSNFGPFNTSTLGGDTSFTGRPKAGRRDFLI